MKCPNCEEKMVVKGYEHMTKIGGFTVTDGTGQALTCERCGEVQLTSKQLAGYERRAALEILTTAQKPVSGEVLKFARKALGLRQKDLAKRLGYSEQQPSRWEAEPETEMSLRLAIALLLTVAENGDPESVNLIGQTPGNKFEIRRAG